jgi:hypothetical protein
MPKFKDRMIITNPNPCYYEFLGHIVISNVTWIHHFTLSLKIALMEWDNISP